MATDRIKANQIDAPVLEDIRASQTCEAIARFRRGNAVDPRVAERALTKIAHLATSIA